MTSWWNVIESVASLTSLLQIAAIICGILSLFMMVFAFVYARKSIRLSGHEGDFSDEKLKTVETAAVDIRKRLGEAQQDRDITSVKLKKAEKEIKHLKKALETSKTKRSVSKQAASNLVSGDEDESSAIVAGIENDIEEKPKGLLTESQLNLFNNLLDPGPRGTIDIIGDFAYFCRPASLTTGFYIVGMPGD